MTPALRAVGLALAAVALAALGCGGEEDDGMTRWSGAGVTFEYPSSWEERDPGDFDLEGLEFVADGPENSAGGRPRTTAIREGVTRPTIRLYGKEIVGARPFELNEGRAAGDREVEILGADAGWRVETRYQAKREDGATDPARAIELLAKKDDRSTSSRSGPRRSRSKRSTRRRSSGRSGSRTERLPCPPGGATPQPITSLSPGTGPGPPPARARPVPPVRRRNRRRW